MRKTNVNGTIILTTEFERKQTCRSRGCKKVLTFYLLERTKSLKSTEDSYLNYLNFKPSTNP